MKGRLARTLPLVVFGILAMPAAARAQRSPLVRSLAPARREDPRGGVAERDRPPMGMCRIWLDGVPAAQQPAPTDCATAVRNRPVNGRVLFPDEPGRERREDAAARTERDSTQARPRRRPE